MNLEFVVCDDERENKKENGTRKETHQCRPGHLLAVMLSLKLVCLSANLRIWRKVSEVDGLNPSRLALSKRLPGNLTSSLYIQSALGEVGHLALPRVLLCRITLLKGQA